MKIGEALKLAQEKLKDIKEAHYLLSAFLRRGLAYLYAHPEEELEGSPAELLRWIEARSQGTPLSYLSHVKEFYGRRFYVDQRVLIPRPETEILVEEALFLIQELWPEALEREPLRGKGSALGGRLAREGPLFSVREGPLFSAREGPLQERGFPPGEGPALRGETARKKRTLEGEGPAPRRGSPGNLTFLDLGTGSGAIAVTLALEVPQAWILASDISSQALEVARINASLHQVQERVTFLQGDLFSPLEEPVDAILANLPYVPENFLKEHPELSFEPPSSLLGGKCGGETISRLLEAAPRWLKVPGFLLLEIGEESVDLLWKAREAFPEAHVSLIYDLQGLPRLLKIKKWGLSPFFSGAAPLF